MSRFRNTDKSMIRRSFSGGPFFFPGFGSGVKMQILNSSGRFPLLLWYLVYVLCFREQMVVHILYDMHVCRQSH